MLVYEGEALALLNAVNWVREFGVQSVTFLSDSEVLIDAVCAVNEGASEFKAIVNLGVF